MFEDIQKHRQAVRENIEKSLQIGFTESEDFEKAHQVGDIHPNGKWVWTQLPSGKFDWRVIKKSPANKKWWNESEIKDAVKRAYKFNSDISITEYGNNGEEIRLRGKNFDYYGKITKISDSTFVAQGKTDFGNVSKNFNNLVDAVKFVTRKHFNLPDEKKISQSQKTTPKKNPAELKTISEVEDYAKSISGVTFKSVKSGWDDKGAKAFELTYPHGGKLLIDFLNNGEYVYKLTDSNDKSIISTNSTDETSHTDWSIRLNPDKLVSRRVEVLKTKLTKLKGEETKARKKAMDIDSSYTDRYNYKRASEAVSDMKTKIQKLQSLIGTF